MRPDHPARGIAHARVGGRPPRTTSSSHQLAAQRGLVMDLEADRSRWWRRRRGGRAGRRRVAIVMRAILAKGRDERECQQGRDDQPEPRGQQVPVPRRARHRPRHVAEGRAVHQRTADSPTT